MIHSRRLKLAVLAATLVAPGAAPVAAHDHGAMPKVEFDKIVLDNGMQVILHVDRKLPIVHVNQWFHVGSKNELPGRTGFAHLFEARHVPGLEERLPGVLHLRREGRRQPPRRGRQRHHVERPHQLLRDGAVGQSRAHPMARVGPTRDAPRGPRRGQARQPARRGQERAPPGTRESTVRALVQAHVREPVSRRPSILLDPDRKSRRSHGRLPRRRQGLLPPLLHAEQPVAGHRRRLRSGRSQEHGREVLRLAPARPGPRTPRYLDPAPRRPSRGRRQRPGAAGASVPRVHDVGVLERRRAGARPGLVDPDRRPLVASQPSARLRPPALLRGPVVQLVARDQRHVRRDRDGAARRVAGRDRTSDRPRARRARRRRPDGGRARARQDQVRVRVRQRPRADRWLRRQGRLAQPVQHLRRRPRPVRKGRRPLPRRQRRRDPQSDRSLARHSQPAVAAVPP